MGFIFSWNIWENQSQFLFVLFKLCTNKNHLYKHNEQINSQHIDNSECFGVNFVKIYPKWLHNKKKLKYGFGWLYRDFFTCGNTFGHILYSCIKYQQKSYEYGWFSFEFWCGIQKFKHDSTSAYTGLKTYIWPKKWRRKNALVPPWSWLYGSWMSNYLCN